MTLPERRIVGMEVVDCRISHRYLLIGQYSLEGGQILG